MPEEVYNAEAHTIYEQGALICYKFPGSIGLVPNHRCCIQEAEVKLREDNTLEAKCGWNRNTFKLEIKEFEFKNA